MAEFALSSSFCGQKKMDESFFRETAENEFDGIAINIRSGHFAGTPSEIRMVKEWSAGYHLPIEYLHCDFEILDPPTIAVFKKAKQVILHNLDIISDLGGKFLVIHSYIFADPDTVIVWEDGSLHPGLSLFRELEDKKSGMMEKVKERMAYYAEEAKRRGVSIALETESRENKFLPEMISEADENHCGICFDSGHAQIEKDAVETAQMVGPRVVCTHLHDNDGKKDLHLPPFKGIIDWKHLLMKLMREGYRETFTFECSGDMHDIIKARDKFVEILNGSSP